MRKINGSLPQLLTYIERNKKKVICFGTGQMLLEVLEYKEIKDAVLCFVDNDEKKQGKDLFVSNIRKKVISPKQLTDMIDDSTILLLVSGHYKSIEQQIKGLILAENTEIAIYPEIKLDFGQEKAEFFQHRIFSDCMKTYALYFEQIGMNKREQEESLNQKKRYLLGNGLTDRPFVLPRMMIMPTTRCNLKCIGCSSLLPLFENPSDVPLIQMIEDIDILLKGIDECIRVTIGGEPFLYPDIKKLLIHLLAQEKVLSIMLITNSTILPKEDMIELLKEPEILVEISDYGHLEKMSRLITLLEKNEVHFKVLTQQNWIDMGGVEYRGRSLEELQFTYLNCEQSRMIKAIYNGNFHICARSARMLALGVYTSEHDYFKLSKEDSPETIRNKIKDMYDSSYADSCNYCDLGMLPTKVIKAGIQMDERIHKSAYTIVNREEYERLKCEAKMKEIE